VHCCVPNFDQRKLGAGVSTGATLLRACRTNDIEQVSLVTPHRPGAAARWRHHQSKMGSNPHPIQSGACSQVKDVVAREPEALLHTSWTGHTCLHAASRQGSLEALKCLVELLQLQQQQQPQRCRLPRPSSSGSLSSSTSGASAGSSDDAGAASSGADACDAAQHPQTMELEAGGRLSSATLQGMLDARDRKGMTALHWAARWACVAWAQGGGGGAWRGLAGLVRRRAVPGQRLPAAGRGGPAGARGSELGWVGG
jgi:ankyrin repeat protein